MAHTTALPAGGIIDDARARRNALILSVAHMLYGCSTTILIISGGLVGQMLAADKAFATLPITTFVLGTVISTVPASMYMRRFGRRAGFMTGAASGTVAALLAIAAIVYGSFWLFCFGTVFAGVYQAFAMYYRFAAADVASDRFKAKGISWVLAGGVAAAVAGPQLVIWTRDALAPFLFAGAFAASAFVSLTAIALTAFVDIPLPPRRPATGTVRPLSQIIAQPRFLVAAFCAMVSYGIMNLVMTATPLAMIACNHTVDDAAFVIQWHALAMFAPSFFTGNLINRFGARTIIIIGLLLLAGCGVIALTGISLEQFLIALILLGLGWNFSFVGATAMLTDAYRPEERNKAQAANDFMVFGTVALASLSSGVLFQIFGWNTVNIALFPFVALAGGLMLWLVWHERRVALA